MNISERYKRRIHVEGKLGDLAGYQLNVKDLETGEAILNVARIALVLDAKKLNRANVVYYEMDENNAHVVKDGEPVMNVALLDDPEVSISAFERFDSVPEEEREGE